MNQRLVIVRGGGDLATGTVHRLWSAGFPVLVLETDHPMAIRRQVAVSEAIYDGKVQIEGMTGIRVDCCREVWNILDRGQVPVMADPEGTSIRVLHPEAVVDGILAKRNLGTHRGMAPLTVALGPGFEAGTDVDVVIETKRGHNLGRVIRSGRAEENTGIPGNIGGYTRERVIYAPEPGRFRNIGTIGDVAVRGQKIAEIVCGDGRLVPVPAPIPGILRGLLRDGYLVGKGVKIADIDPRQEERGNCFTISDKARCIAGSVLEVIVSHILHK